MINNAQLLAREGHSFSGEYIIRNLNSQVSQINRPYTIFEIQPNLLPVKVIAWKDTCKGHQNIFHGKKIGIEGYWHSFNGKLQVKCTSVSDLNNDRQEIAKAKIRLRALLIWQKDSSLKEFVKRVFNDKSIIDDFSIAPASLNHHHAFPGGLLVHSVDTAWKVFNNQQIESYTRQIGTVVALLHDIGKIKALSSDMTRTDLGMFVDHENLSLEILAPHLSWLENIDTELAIAIRYLLTWKKKSYDPIPKLDVYEIIRAADRVSAGSG